MANNTGSIIAALLGGAIVGAMAALLFAPKSGQELREDVARIAREKASLQGWGPVKIRFQLRGKGISDEIVSEALQAAGIDPSRIETYWYGDTERISRIPEKNRATVLLTK